MKPPESAKLILPDGNIVYDAVALAKMETEGCFIKDIVGYRAVVRTQNTCYEFEVHANGITGQAFKEDGSVPNFLAKRTVDVKINGSTWGGSMLKVGYIGVDMYLEFHYSGNPYRITTSSIESIKLEKL